MKAILPTAFIALLRWQVTKTFLVFIVIGATSVTVQKVYFFFNKFSEALTAK